MGLLHSPDPGRECGCNIDQCCVCGNCTVRAKEVLAEFCAFSCSEERTKCASQSAGRPPLPLTDGRLHLSMFS